MSNILSRTPESRRSPPPARGRTRAASKGGTSTGAWPSSPRSRGGGRGEGRGGAAVSDRRRSQDPRRQDPARDLPHLGGRHLPGARKGVVHRRADQVLQHPHVVGGDHFLLDAHGEELLAAVHDGHHHPAARRPLDGAPPKLLLETLEPVAHLLRLPHQVLEVRHPPSSTGSGNSGSPPSPSAATSFRGTSTGGAGCTLTSIDPSKVRKISRTTGSSRAFRSRPTSPRGPGAGSRRFFSVE